MYHRANSHTLFTCVLSASLIYPASMADFLSEPLGLEGGIVYSLTRNKWLNISNLDNEPNRGMLTSINLYFAFPIPCPNYFNLLVMFYDSLFDNRIFQVRKRISIFFPLCLLPYIMKEVEIVFHKPKLRRYC